MTSSNQAQFGRRVEQMAVARGLAGQAELVHRALRVDPADEVGVILRRVEEHALGSQQPEGVCSPQRGIERNVALCLKPHGQQGRAAAGGRVGITAPALRIGVVAEPREQDRFDPIWSAGGHVGPRHLRDEPKHAVRRPVRDRPDDRRAQVRGRAVALLVGATQERVGRQIDERQREAARARVHLVIDLHEAKRAEGTAVEPDGYGRLAHAGLLDPEAKPRPGHQVRHALVGERYGGKQEKRGRESGRRPAESPPFTDDVAIHASFAPSEDHRRACGRADRGGTGRLQGRRVSSKVGRSVGPRAVGRGRPVMP